MINFLAKIFIKDYQNINDEKVREKYGMMGSFGGIIINVLLITFKLLIGILTFSLSIIADAINNITDFFSCFVSLFGFKISSKPADKKHPYGHQRIEYISGLIVAIVIIISGAMLAYTSIESLIEHSSQLNLSIWAFVILGISILLKVLLAIYYYRLSIKINSLSLKASMLDSINDAIATSAILISSLVQYFCPTLWFIDSSMSLAVSLFIFVGGIKMSISIVSPLLGSPLDEKYINNIKKDILSYKGVLGVHDLIFHTYGPSKIFMTAHVEVDGFVSSFKSHELIESIEKEVGEKYSINLTIHVDTVDTKDERIPVVEDDLKKTLSKINNQLSFHDVRLFNSNDSINISFDLVVPFSLKIDKVKVEEIIEEELKKINKKYHAIINFEHDYND